MKKPNLKKLHGPQRSLKALAVGLGLAAVLLPGSLRAATSLYFDVNGTTSGFGTASGNTYSWDSTNWNTSSGGTAATGNWVSGDFARFLGGGSYTVTVANTEVMAGMFLDIASTTMTVNAIGSGNLSVTPTGGPIQGFLTDGSLSTLIINAPITGSGGVEAENGGSLYLCGNNTFSGGFLFGTTGGVNINNNNSFGTGPITWGDTTYQILSDTNGNGFPTAPGPLNITNSMTTIATTFPGYQLIVVTAPTNAITFSGPWTNAAGGYSRLTMNTIGTIMTIAGQVYGSGSIFKDGPGRLILDGPDTNNGQSIIVTNGVFEIGANGVFDGPLYITNTAGQLQLDAPTCLTVSNTLVIGSSLSNNAINLNFTGTNTIYALNLNGALQGPGTYGSSTSGAQNQNAVFTGSGILSISAAPAILQQPEPLGRFVGASASFSVTASGLPLNYQWYFDGAPMSGQTSSTLSISPVATNNAGSYTVVVSNSLNTVTSLVTILKVLPVTFYPATILSNNPIAYWRLDETSGIYALDDVGTNDGGYVNVTLDQPGFSLTDPDTSIGLPANSSARGYMMVSNATANFNFPAAPDTTQFTLEAWALFTNITGVERLISTFGNGTGWAWGINGNNAMRFTQGAVQDADLTLTNLTIATGVWYYFAFTYDGNNYNYYVNGNYMGSVAPSGHGNVLTGALTVGCDPPAYTYTSEQVQGNIDEVAIYTTALSSNTIMQDYNARNGTLAPPVVSAPAVSPATNYVSLSSEFQAVASGQSLSYQWYMEPSILLTGQTNSTLTLTDLSLTNNGYYFVQVSNTAGTTNSPATALTVLAIPTNASQLNLTNGLLLHMPFNSNLDDISGHGNNGTAVGTISYVTPAAVGSSALQYSSSPPNYNYVTLGVPSDLVFGATTNFTVSMWVQQPASSAYTNLPFFSDQVGSTTGGNTGFSFAPYDSPGGGTSGGWQWSLNTTASPNQFTSFNDANIINDGNWHNLVFAANRSGNMTTYVDGQQADSQAINFLGSIDSGTNVNIGQDPTGTYAVTGQANINDLAVWNTLLTPLQISGLYLGGASNNISFAPAIVSGPTYITLTNQLISGQWQLTWPEGNLQSTTNLTTPWTNVPSGTSPYVIPSGQTSIFYRVHP